MKIYTKTGDEGKTSLFDNSRVWKSDERILSYGAVDELNSSIGVALSLELDPEIKDILIKIQNDLFIVGSDLANCLKLKRILSGFPNYVRLIFPIVN